MRNTDLGRRPRSREDLAGWYAEALEEQAASGMTVAEYAEEIGISAATLYQWRRRLAPGSEAPRSSRAGFGLVEVTVGGAAVEPEPDSAESFVVRVAGDRAIEVPRGFGDAELRRLVRVLESC